MVYHKIKANYQSVCIVQRKRSGDLRQPTKMKYVTPSRCKKLTLTPWVGFRSG